MNALAYEVTPGVVERDRDAVLDVWSGHLGHDDRMRRKYAWFYLGSPGGPPMLGLLRVVPGGRVGGAPSAGPRRMLLDGREVRGGLLVDLAVATSHRAFGPALMLQGHFVEHGDERFDMLYGFPNEKAEPVFRRAGHARLGEMVRYVRVLRHARYLARHVPAALAGTAGMLVDRARQLALAVRVLAGDALRVEWTDAADSRFDDLWSRSAPREGMSGIHDAAFARWRFDQSPLGTTRYLLLSRPGDDRLLAWFACQDGARGSLDVIDFWSEDAAHGIGRRFVDALLLAAWRTGATSVAVEYAAPPTMLAGWTGAGFVERTRRPLYGRALAGALPADGPLHITAADEDE